MTIINNKWNVIALTSRKSRIEIKDIIDKFLNTPFSNEERHVRRINMLIDYDENEIGIPATNG